MNVFVIVHLFGCGIVADAMVPSGCAWMGIRLSLPKILRTFN